MAIVRYLKHIEQPLHLVPVLIKVHAHDRPAREESKDTGMEARGHDKADPGKFLLVLRDRSRLNHSQPVAVSLLGQSLSDSLSKVMVSTVARNDEVDLTPLDLVKERTRYGNRELERSTRTDPLFIVGGEVFARLIKRSDAKPETIQAHDQTEGCLIVTAW